MGLFDKMSVLWIHKRGKKNGFHGFSSILLNCFITKYFLYILRLRCLSHLYCQRNLQVYEISDALHQWMLDIKVMMHPRLQNLWMDLLVTSFYITESTILTAFLYQYPYSCSPLRVLCPAGDSFPSQQSHGRPIQSIAQ